MIDQSHLPTIDLELSEYLHPFLMYFHKLSPCTLHHQHVGGTEGIMLLNHALFDEPIVIAHDDKGFICPAHLEGGKVRLAKLTIEDSKSHTGVTLAKAMKKANQREEV